MLEKITKNWKLIAFAAACLAIVKLSSCAARIDGRVIEEFYQSAQAVHQAELVRRQANIERLEKIEKETAAAHQERIEKMAADTDARIAALKWKTNAELRKAKATSEKILTEKAKAETALAEMTLNRDGLVAAAKTREKEVTEERAKLKTEHLEALKEKTAKLDLCDKARKAALAGSNKKTWLSIGPGITVFVQGGEVRHAYGVSIQIPIIEIKSPFKRF